MTKPNDSGQALLEIAFSFAFFLLLVFAVIDFGFMFCSKLTLQNAVRQAGRYAITGQCITGSNGNCSQSRYQSIISVLETNSIGLINSSNVTSDVAITCINEGGGCPNNAGGPGDTVIITVTYPYPFLTPLIAPFFPNHSYTVNVSAAFTNESFAPGQS
ncbi:MAG TPA: TadE family protein [Terriglobales bacterium]|nr:TadE family protein [Terriglobales bacterium]